jgi:hypothetical protein
MAIYYEVFVQVAQGNGLGEANDSNMAVGTTFILSNSILFFIAFGMGRMNATPTTLSCEENRPL